jgi:transposase-like protein
MTVNTDESTVSCPACESENIAQIAARAPIYRCRDCNNEFRVESEPIE